MGAGSSYSAGATGGEATHTLTVNEMPSHQHGLSMDSGAGSSYGIPVSTKATGGSYAGYMFNTGGSAAHNNMPPYLVVYMWKRIA